MGERVASWLVGRGARVRGAMAVLAGVLVTSCALDSRWFEQKRLQEAAVQHATPKELADADRGDGAPAALRVMRISAHATPRYSAEVVEWTRQLEGMVESANQVLEPTLGIRLEVAEAKAWRVQGDEQSLRALIEELAATDAGQGVDWVIGLSGSSPRAEESFHELGMATSPGKHIVMRAMNDAREYEWIQKELTRIDEAERRKLYAARKKHKTTVVLLHELGHTMGLIHQPDASAIMSPRYSTKAERWGDAATAWMRAFLREKTGKAEPGEPPLAVTVLDLLTNQPEAWVAAERDELAKRLAAQIAAASAVAARGRSAQGASGAQPAMGGASEAAAGAGASALSEADQRVFEEAAAKEKAGKYMDAYDQAKPLYKRYPDEMSVQDLRCRLIMQLDAEVETVQSECAQLMILSGVRKKK